MTLNELIGSFGVTLLLLAFVLNLRGFFRRFSRAYQAMNAFGAGVACYASYRIGYVPFVVLEGMWATVALAALARPGRFAG